jgi:quinol monooxygenase YgiN
MAEIVRVFHARSNEGMAEEFEVFFVEEALPMVRSHPGLVSVHVGLPLETTPHSFCMVSVWASVDALKGFAGEDWRQAVIDPREEDLLAEVSVFHYERLAE